MKLLVNCKHWAEDSISNGGDGRGGVKIFFMDCLVQSKNVSKHIAASYQQNIFILQ